MKWQITVGQFVLGFAGVLALAVHLRAQGDSSSQIVVDDPRPVANAAAKLESLYGHVITYEDQQWAVPSETKDVTESVRRDIGDRPLGTKNSGPRVLIPKGGSFAFPAPESVPSGMAELVTVVQKMITASSLAGNPGTFQILQSGGQLHIVPSGQMASKNHRVQIPLLDSKIEIPEKNWNGLEVLDELCERLSTASGQHVVLGTLPVNSFVHHRGNYGGSGIARDLLVSVLGSIGPMYSWQLLFDPGLRTHVLNIHTISH